MKPFLRPTDRAPLAPVGWVAEPAGEWGGRTVHIVYDPRRHDCVLARNRIPDLVRSGLADAGYRRVAADGDQELWIRDRVDVVRAALARIDRRSSRLASPGIVGPS